MDRAEGPNAFQVAFQVAFHGDAVLGEAPAWDARTGTLWWVDIPGDTVFNGDPRTGRYRAVRYPGTVSAVVPRASGGVVGATDHGFAALYDDGTWTILDPIDLPSSGADRPDLRMNDGKCDPLGRFWAGTMARDAAPGAGTLYRLGTDRTARPMLSGLTISNGLGWSPDGTRMYFIDSGDQGVDELSFGDDPAAPAAPTAPSTPRASAPVRRRLIDIDPADGVPDGMTVDAEGYLWIALCYGGQVRRYAPDGRLDRVVHLPAKLTTSVCFGGDDLAKLFVTTGTRDLTAAERAATPLAGSVLVVDPGVRGLPTVAYAG